MSSTDPKSLLNAANDGKDDASGGGAGSVSTENYGNSSMYPAMPPPINNYPSSYPMMPSHNGMQMPPQMYGYPPAGYPMSGYPHGPGMYNQPNMFPPQHGYNGHAPQSYWQPHQQRMMQWPGGSSAPPAVPPGMLGKIGMKDGPSPDAHGGAGGMYGMNPYINMPMRLPHDGGDVPSMSGGAPVGGEFPDSSDFLPSELYDFFLTDGMANNDTIGVGTPVVDGAGTDLGYVMPPPLSGGMEMFKSDFGKGISATPAAATTMKKRKRTAKTMALDEDASYIGNPKRGGRSKERNREHAKRARIRKKFFLDGLKDRIKSIEDENRLMRRVIEDRTGMPFPEFMRMDALAKKDGKPAVTFKDKVEEESLFEDVIPKDNFGNASLHLLQHLQKANQNFTITNPHLPDNPIIYASQGFYDMCGYDRSEVLGRNCRFLQGSKTDRKNVLKLRNCVATASKKGVCLLNYKKDGTPFWNYVFVSPLKNAEGRVIMFIGVQCVLASDDAKSVIDTAAEIAAECVNAQNPQQAADDAIKLVRLDDKGSITLKGVDEEIEVATAK